MEERKKDWFKRIKESGKDRKCVACAGEFWRRRSIQSQRPMSLIFSLSLILFFFFDQAPSRFASLEAEIKMDEREQKKSWTRLLLLLFYFILLATLLFGCPLAGQSCFFTSSKIHRESPLQHRSPLRSIPKWNRPPFSSCFFVFFRFAIRQKSSSIK